MEIKEKIEYYLNQNKLVEETKQKLIDAHLEQINKVIEDKILALQNELRESAINEVCGEEYNVLNKEIEKNNRHIAILTEIEEETGFIDVLKEIIPVTTENGSEMAEDKLPEDLPKDNTITEETVTENTNKDNLGGMLN